VDQQAVTRLEGERLHRRQRLRGQLGQVVEQEGEVAGRPVVQVIAGRGVITVVEYQPAPVGSVPAQQPRLARASGPQARDVAGQRGVEYLKLPALPLDDRQPRPT